MGKLTEYREKRKFDVTPEPRGTVKGSEGPVGIFVIHRHQAHIAGLHFDLRLEIDGGLTSWALPKGMSHVTSERRFAAETEIHPMEYATFEGTIPAGNYGAGTVEIYDSGYWVCDIDPMIAYINGMIKFTLYGNKVRGRWVLVRTHEEGRKWLVIKEKHDISHTDLVRKGERRDIPANMDIMKLAQTVAPAEGDQFLHEVKEDGTRLKVMVTPTFVDLRTRNNKSWDHKLPTIVGEFKNLLVLTAWFDCELVVYNQIGTSSFEGVQNLAKNETDAVLLIHDIMYLDGYDLRNLPLLLRKEILAYVFKKSKETPHIRQTLYLIGNGPRFFRVTCQFGHEGIVSKLIGSKYDAEQSHFWFKTPCHVHRMELVIGGYTKSDKREFSALLVGAYNDNKQLAYVSKVGTGFTLLGLADLHERLVALHDTKCPFSSKPDVGEEVQWVKPVLIAVVEFREMTSGGSLRKPRYKGLRDDKDAPEVKLTLPLQTATSEDIVNPITSPTKELWTGITKQQLMQYYMRLDKLALYHMVNRPLMLTRCNENVNGGTFYQKTVNWRSMFVKMENGVMYIDSLNGLIELVQMNTVEIHSWNCDKFEMDIPDRMVIDLDPGEDGTWSRVADGAIIVKEYLDNEMHLESFVKTTGKKGLHIVVPLLSYYGWEEVYDVSKKIAQALVHEYPSTFTTAISKLERGDKIYLDVARNTKGATIVEAYSTRAVDGAPISCPINWDDVTPTKRTFTVNDLEEILGRTNPWEHYDLVENRLY